jgi:CubicO group peptidase (beta-lactamase class C family)
MDRLGELDGFIRREMARLKAPGLSIVVVEGDRVLLEKGYGWADRALGRKVGADTIFSVASISKLFTNAAVMKLWEAGKVDLDAPIASYIPELGRMKARGSSLSDVTVRSMLTHHSGLPSDLLRGFLLGKGVADYDPAAFRELPRLLEGCFVATPPGTVFSYSNLSYSLLGLMVERVSGLGFADYVDESVLKPLGMSSSSFRLDPALEGRYAVGYEKGRKAVPIKAIRDIPAGQLVSSAHDMGLFLMAVLASLRGEAGLLEKATMEMVLSPQNAGAALDFGFQIGLTWWLMEVPELPGLKVAGHGGDLSPFHSLLLVVPERELAMEINVNNAAGMGSMELKPIAMAALAAVMAEAPVDGWYSCMLGLVRLERRGDGLSLFLKGRKLKAFRREDGSFGLEYRLLGLVRVPIAILKELSFRIEWRDGRPWLAFVVAGIPYGCAERLDPEPITSVWRERLGSYAILNPDPGTDVGHFALRLDKTSGFLLLEFKAFGDMASYPIRTLSDSEFVTWGMGRNMGEAGIFDPAEGGEALRFSGFILRKEKGR